MAILVAMATMDSPADAAIHFNQLSSCDSLSEAYTFLRKSQQHCRAPGGRIERSIDQQTNFIPSIKICFLDRIPSAALSSFKCMTVVNADLQRELLCYQSADIADIKDYRERYDTVYAPKVIQYLQLAAACSVGNGDPTVSVGIGMLPYLMSLVARSELGFILPTGGSLVGSGLIIHGYGTVDPDLRSGISALEFFSMRIPR